MVIDWGEGERRLTESVSVLVGEDNGAYPSGNTLLVRGVGESVVIGPSVTVVERSGAPVEVDAVINEQTILDEFRYVPRPMHRASSAAQIARSTLSTQTR